MIRTLLQVPLAMKLLVANGALLGAAVGSGLWLSRSDALIEWPGGFVLLVIVLLGMIGINSILVTIALRPLKGLERAADRVSQGELDAHVPSSPVADRSLERLIRTFNHMVEAMRRTHASRDRLSRDLLEAAERDRKQLADELLNGPAQTLSTTLLLLRRNGPGDPSDGSPADAVREALEELRRISAALHPPELDELGLATALRALVRSRLESRGIHAQVKVEGTAGGIPPWLRLGAYRLVQEAVEISARLPGTTQVSVCLRRDGACLLARVELSRSPESLAAGTPRQAVDGTPGSGLHRMVERARLLGGSLSIEEGAGSQLAILVRLPVEEPQSATDRVDIA